MNDDKELWIRVFPDDILIESHDSELTRGEVKAGRAFKKDFNKIPKGAFPNEEEVKQHRKIIWRELASAFGQERAAWIAKTIDNYSHISDDNLVDFKEDADFLAPRVHALPDYFMFAVYDANGQIAYRRKGQPIPNSLPLMAGVQENDSPEEQQELLLRFFLTLEDEAEAGGRFGEVLGYAHVPEGKEGVTKIVHKVMQNIKEQSRPSQVARKKALANPWKREVIDPKKRSANIMDALYEVFIKPFETSFFDEQARWLEDFDTAVAKGMAIKIQLTNQQPPFQRLVVVGVQESLDAMASATMVEKLFENHRYTEGLAFLTPDTSTNNTARVRSGHSESTEDYDQTFELEFGEVGVTHPHAWGQRLRSSLGMRQEADVFRRIEHAQRFEDSYANFLHGLLWEVTGEPFLRVFLGELTAGATDLWSWLRQHVRQHLRPLGLLPVIRIGNQPYGILPVTKTSNWTTTPGSSGAESEQQVVKVLNGLMSHWLAQAIKPDMVPRIQWEGEGSTDPDQGLFKILSMAPQAQSYTKRRYHDRRFLEWWLHKKIGTDLSETVDSFATYFLSGWEEDKQPEHAVLTGLGAIESQVQETLLWRIWGFDHGSEFVQEELTNFTRETVPIDPQVPRDTFLPTPVNYLKAIVEGLFLERKVKAPNTLFFQLLQEMGLSVVRERPELNKLAELENDHRRDWIERLFVSFLDAQTHRLDAWVTSLANKRLVEMRQQKPEGLYLGAYGWLENLVPRATSQRGKPGGYIHAPSLDHAKAGAVLRNAFLSYEDPEHNPYAINLTSRRIQRACRVLMGVREGHSLGVLLGYLVERALRDAKLDQFIDKFRHHYPLDDQVEESEATEPTEAITPRNVMNGLTLIQSIRRKEITKEAVVTEKLEATRVDRGHGKKLLQVITDACDVVDAMTDLLLNESVFQWVQGKYEQAGAATAAIGGKGPPPELESIATPIAGTTAQHRVVLVLPNYGSKPPEDTEINARSNVRGAMEPALSFWVNRIFGDWAQISCHMKVDSQPNDVLLTAKDLQLYPLDLVYFSKFDEVVDQEAEREQSSESETSVSQEFGVNPLEAWIRCQLWMRGVISLDDKIIIDWSTPADSSHRSFADILHLARAIRQLIGHSTVLAPNHWVSLDVAEDPAVLKQWTNLLRRLKFTANTVIEQRKLDGLVKKLSTVNQPQNQLILSLLAATRLGMVGVLPTAASLENETALNQLRVKALEEIQVRLQTYHRLWPGYAETDTQIQSLADAEREWQRRGEALQTLFGKDFTLIPHCWAPDTSTLAQALRNGIAPQVSTTLENETRRASSNRLWLWFHQAAQTRPQLQHLEETFMVLDAGHHEQFETSVPGSLHQPSVAQLPPDEKRYWVGLSQDEIEQFRSTQESQNARAVDDEENFPKGTLSIVAFSEGEIHPATTPVHGFLVDEFTELIPDAQVHTGIAFQYDQPNSQPPQACLLAVPSRWNRQSRRQTSEQWTMEEVIDTVKETMDLARLRTVDLDALETVRTLTPGLFHAQFSSPPDVSKIRLLDVGALAPDDLDRRLFWGNEIQVSASSSEQLIRHYVEDKQGNRHLGFKFIKSGFNILGRWDFKVVEFHVMFQKAGNLPTTSEVFEVTVRHFDAGHGLFEERTEQQTIRVQFGRGGVSKGVIKISDERPIVGVAVSRVTPRLDDSHIVLRTIRYQFRGQG